MVAPVIVAAGISALGSIFGGGKDKKKSSGGGQLYQSLADIRNRRKLQEAAARAEQDAKRAKDEETQQAGMGLVNRLRQRKSNIDALSGGER